jgi:hypothetical protein
MLLLCELLAWCSSSCCIVEYNVMFTFLHTHTKKKKNCTCYVRLDVMTKREGGYCDFHRVTQRSKETQRIGLVQRFSGLKCMQR